VKRTKTEFQLPYRSGMSRARTQSAEMAEVDLRRVTQQNVDEPFELSHCGESIRTGEVVGSIPTAPTTSHDISESPVSNDNLGETTASSACVANVF
jgi:hypothetical protein